MFAFNYRVGLERIAMTYLVCKVLKFIVSAMLLMFYRSEEHTSELQSP